MLPGFSAAQFFVSNATAALLTSVSYVDHTTSNGSSISYPNGIQSGDVAILVDYAFGSSRPSTVVPSGFSSINNHSNSNGRAIESYKLCNGTESGSVTGMNSIATDKVIILFRGNKEITSVTPGGATGIVTNSNPSARTITSGSGVAPMLVFGAFSGGGAFNEFTPSHDQRVSHFSIDVRWKLYDSGDNPVNHTIDTSDIGDVNILQGFYLQFA